MKSQDFDIQEIIEQIVQFTKDREWDQFHNGKDLALALSIEASELNEAFLCMGHRTKRICLLYTSPSPRDSTSSRMP